MRSRRDRKLSQNVIKVAFIFSSKSNGEFMIQKSPTKGKAVTKKFSHQMQAIVCAKVNPNFTLTNIPIVLFSLATKNVQIMVMDFHKSNPRSLVFIGKHFSRMILKNYLQRLRNLSHPGILRTVTLHMLSLMTQEWINLSKKNTLNIQEFRRHGKHSY